MLRATLWALAIASLLVLPTNADTIVFNNFSPGGTYLPSVAWGFHTGFSQGEAFTPGTSVYLTQIDVALQFADFWPGPYVATLSLYSDSGGAPGTLLESWTVNVLTPWDALHDSGHESLISTTNVFLVAGSQYWLIASDDYHPECCALYWNLNSIGGLGLHYQDGSVFEAEQSAFRVMGTEAQIPEPSTLLLFGSGLFGLAGVLRRKLHA